MEEYPIELITYLLRVRAAHGIWKPLPGYMFAASCTRVEILVRSYTDIHRLSTSYDCRHTGRRQRRDQNSESAQQVFPEPMHLRTNRSGKHDVRERQTRLNSQIPGCRTAYFIRNRVLRRLGAMEQFKWTRRCFRRHSSSMITLFVYDHF